MNCRPPPTAAGKNRLGRVAKKQRPPERSLNERHRRDPATDPLPSLTRLREDPVAQVFTLLRIGFFVLPVLMGLDKFAEVMNDNWPAYLATEFNDIIPGSAQDAMYAVGAVEILAGFIVLIVPRFGGLLVAGWLAASSSACCWSAATATSRCAISGCCSERSRCSGSPAPSRPIRPTAD